jgi:hypothetical protein
LSLAEMEIYLNYRFQYSKCKRRSGLFGKGAQRELLQLERRFRPQEFADEEGSKMARRRLACSAARIVSIPL